MKTEYHKYEEIKQYTIDKLEGYRESNVYGCDLHNELFNIDYYIIGRYNSKEWLKEFTFNAIDIIKEYEQDNFGEVNTDFSEPENVVNMYVYIIGEEVLQESKTLQDNWNNILTSENIDDIINELRKDC